MVTLFSLQQRMFYKLFQNS